MALVDADMRAAEAPAAQAQSLEAEKVESVEGACSISQAVVAAVGKPVADGQEGAKEAAADALSQAETAPPSPTGSRCADEEIVAVPDAERSLPASDELTAAAVAADSGDLPPLSDMPGLNTVVIDLDSPELEAIAALSRNITADEAEGGAAEISGDSATAAASLVEELLAELPASACDSEEKPDASLEGVRELESEGVGASLNAEPAAEAREVDTAALPDAPAEVAIPAAETEEAVVDAGLASDADVEANGDDSSSVQDAASENVTPVEETRDIAVADAGVDTVSDVEAREFGMASGQDAGADDATPAADAGAASVVDVEAPELDISPVTDAAGDNEVSVETRELAAADAGDSTVADAEVRELDTTRDTESAAGNEIPLETSEPPAANIGDATVTDSEAPQTATPMSAAMVAISAQSGRALDSLREQMQQPAVASAISAVRGAGDSVVRAVAPAPLQVDGDDAEATFLSSITASLLVCMEPESATRAVGEDGIGLKAPAWVATAAEACAAARDTVVRTVWGEAQDEWRPMEEVDVPAADMDVTEAKTEH